MGKVKFGVVEVLNYKIEGPENLIESKREQILRNKRFNSLARRNMKSRKATWFVGKKIITGKRILSGEKWSMVKPKVEERIKKNIIENREADNKIKRIRLFIRHEHLKKRLKKVM